MASSSSTASQPGLASRLWQRPAARGASLLLLALALAALVGPALLGIDPAATGPETFSPPSGSHFLGTDVNGRDLLARILQGARVSLTVGIAGAAVSLVIGTLYGLISGYAGGNVDNAMMRLLEILYAIPRLILIILATFVLDPLLQRYLGAGAGRNLLAYSRIFILIFSLGLIEWLTMARIVRGQVLALREATFVTAARALGQSHVRILFRHLLPNLLGVVVVYLTLTVPAVILDESFLSFLGLGVQPPHASWGTLLADGAQAINPVRSHWWLLLFPACAMSLTLLALNFLGDALRDALDPRDRS
jgi:peptide/nickel transport system permease protein/oligopeptide transport system permease protein